MTESQAPFGDSDMPGGVMSIDWTESTIDPHAVAEVDAMIDAAVAA